MSFVFLMAGAACAGPFARQELVSLLNAKLPSAQLTQMIEARGVAFAADTAAIRELRRAGASDTVVDAVAEAVAEASAPRNAGGLWQGTVVGAFQVVSPKSHAWKIFRIEARLRERASIPIRVAAPGAPVREVGRKITLFHEGSAYEERFLYRGEGGPGEGGGTTKLDGWKSGSIRFRTAGEDQKLASGGDAVREGRYAASFAPPYEGGQGTYPVRFPTYQSTGGYLGVFIGASLPSSANCPPGMWVSGDPPSTLIEGGTRIQGTFTQGGSAPSGQYWWTDMAWELTRVSADSPPAAGETSPADLEIALETGPAPVVAGKPLTCRIRVTNHGPAAAVGVIASLTFAGDVAAGSATSASGACTRHEHGFRCRIPSLARDASAAIEITITPRAAGEIKLFASAIGATPDPDAQNNFGEKSLTVAASAETRTAGD